MRTGCPTCTNHMFITVPLCCVFSFHSLWMEFCLFCGRREIASKTDESVQPPSKAAEGWCFHDVLFRPKMFKGRQSKRLIPTFIEKTDWKNRLKIKKSQFPYERFYSLWLPLNICIIKTPINERHSLAGWECRTWFNCLLSLMRLAFLSSLPQAQSCQARWRLHSLSFNGKWAALPLLILCCVMSSGLPGSLSSIKPRHTR